MATGTYKPQHHTYHLPSLALKYTRHHVSLNLAFFLLSQDYSKSVHLQTDRTIEFHTPMGCHYSIRIPRYGRALGYQKQRAEVVIPAYGNEVYRLDLESGRFLKPFELSADVESGESIAVESNCHGLLAFGTSKGSVEFWDPRSRDRIGILTPPKGDATVIGFARDAVLGGSGEETNPAITALEFAMNGLNLATGSATGITTLFDIRSPRPLLTKDQQYGFPIHSLRFMTVLGSQDERGKKVLSSDKKIIKIWDQETGKPWTAIEPSVDLNHIEPVPDTGMIFTANEGKEMHSFFIPQLGPAPRWCSFLDNLTEEMAERHLNDPDAYSPSDEFNRGTYDNFKFLTKAELASFGLDTLIGTPKGMSILRPYMHGYFISQKLYEEVRLHRDPFEWERERAAMIRRRIEKERESRIRTSRKDRTLAQIKVNKALAEKLLRQDEKLAKKRGRKANQGGEGNDDGAVIPEEGAEDETVVGKLSSLLKDKRFGNLFEDPEFAIDENTLEYQQLHPAQAHAAQNTSLTVDSMAASSEGGTSSNDDSDSGSTSEAETPDLRPKPKAEPEMRISSSSYRKSGHSTRGFDLPQPSRKRHKPTAEKTFQARAAGIRGPLSFGSRATNGEVWGDKEIKFSVDGRAKNGKPAGEAVGQGGKRGPDMSMGGGNRAGRRSASGNTFRRMGFRA